MNAEAAWGIVTATSNVIVADLDSGFALNHQDLQNVWHINSGETGGGKENDGIDNDSNGYVDDSRGWDFTADDKSPQAGTTNSSGLGVSHGTEVAGLIAAQTDNSIGVASIGRGASIMPLQVLSDDGTGTTASVVPAIYYAVDNGAGVINMSLGTDGDDPDVRVAIDYAVDRGVVVVAAAGNCGVAGTDGACLGHQQGYITFPASYPKVISVGALNQSGQRASFGSYGERLDVSAPGAGSISSPTWQAGNQISAYKSTLNGTSYASPLVAGTAALLRTQRPATSVDDIRALIMGTARKIAAMNGIVYTQTFGHGEVDAGQATHVARDLNVTAAVVPALAQAGNAQSEGAYGVGDTIASGCKVAAATWCTVRLSNDALSYDRFLPYQLTDSTGSTGWTWSGQILQHGEWSVRSLQGDTYSNTPKFLFSK